jgi:hypothetical protein
MNLRFLHLDVWCRRDSKTGLTLLLSHVTSVRIEDLSLDVLHCPANGHSHDCVPMEWGDMDAILAQQQFLNLKSVSVHHTEYMSSTEYLFEWFFD